VLTDAEVCALMGACGRYAPIGLRDRALIALLYRAGLRINEALSLYPKDLDLADGSVRVLNGKGGRSRTVGLDPGAAAMLERWLMARARLNVYPTGGTHFSPGGRSRRRGMSGRSPVGPGRSPVFCTLPGRPMSDAYVRVLLKRLAARAGIDKRVHAHGLRHTHAAQLRAEGVDIGIISRQLGHASITTTARYLDHLAPRAVVETMRNRSWWAE
jgi:site-specific recombinase XerD